MGTQTGKEMFCKTATISWADIRFNKTAPSHCEAFDKGHHYREALPAQEIRETIRGGLASLCSAGCWLVLNSKVQCPKQRRRRKTCKRVQAEWQEEVRHRPPPTPKWNQGLVILFFFLFFFHIFKHSLSAVCFFGIFSLRAITTPTKFLKYSFPS